LVDLDLGPGALLNGHDGLSPAPDHLAYEGLGAFHHLVVRERDGREEREERSGEREQREGDSASEEGREKRIDTVRT